MNFKNFRGAIFLISFFLIPWFKSYGQDKEKSGGIAIKISPLNLMEKNFPVAQGNVEIQLNQKWSISPEFGIKISSLNPQPDTAIFKNYSGYRLMLEVRKYLLPARNVDKAYCRAYITASAFFSSNKYNSSFFNYDSTYNKNETFGVSQKFYGIESRFGLQMVYFNKILIDWYAGIGIKHKEIKNPGFIYPDTPLYAPIDVNYFSTLYPNNDLAKSSGVVPMLSFGVKIGYIITKNRFR